MKRFLTSMIAALMLTACASGMQPIPVQSRPCAANLTTDCPVPPKAASGHLADLLQNHIEAMELYTQCRDQLHKLAECANDSPINR